ncbi:hypothetical protein [Sphingomonas sp. 37zxx]|uniref:hypothetical protein n=1 Tax=Sphingomonas sp. 37zxx TaxID=1550073 RepID=UPI000A6C69A5|nr:hypothetical protein [Sphingomonas sp. 37zxx]
MPVFASTPRAEPVEAKAGKAQREGCSSNRQSLAAPGNTLPAPANADFGTVLAVPGA